MVNVPTTALAELDRLLQGYEGACVAGAAAELDLFTPLVHAPMSAAELAAARRADPQATTTLLDALAGMALLEKSAEEPPRYRVAESYRELLDINHPHTFVPMLRHRMTCARHWVELARVAQSGQPAAPAPSVLGENEDYRSFVLAMNSIGLSTAKEVAARLAAAGLLAFKRLLDVGGASGTYTLAFLERNPGAEAILFDRPAALEEAKQRFAATPYAAQVHFASGDFIQDELPSGADFAWVSAIIHMFDREHARALYQKVRRALEPGGIIAVRDFVMEADRVRPLAGAFFAVNMLTATQTGRCYTLDEIREDLEAAGFVDARYALPAETMSAIVTARKP